MSGRHGNEWTSKFIPSLHGIYHTIERPPERERKDGMNQDAWNGSRMRGMGAGWNPRNEIECTYIALYTKHAIFEGNLQ